MTAENENETSADDAEIVEVIADDNQDIDGTPEVDPAPEIFAEPETRSRAGVSILALIAGGVLAGAIGFAVGRLDQGNGWLFSNGPDLQAQNTASIDAMTARLAQIETDVKKSEAAQADQAQLLSALPQGLATSEDVSATQAQWSQQLDALAVRLQDLENRPIPDVGATQAAVDAYETELTAMREMFAAELANIKAVQSEALSQQSTIQAQTQSAAFDAVTARLATLAGSGADLTDAIADLRKQDIAISPVLETHSTGIPSLNSLRGGFPDVARATLAASIEKRAQSGEISGLQAFLQKQLGARSLEPKEGTDPDAVLARAEAELSSGNIEAAVTEARTLTGLAVDELDNWLAAANTHIDVMRAIAELEPNSAK